MSKPRFDPSSLSSVWSNKTLSLPSELADCFQAILKEIGKLEDARGQAPDKVIGGITKEAAEQHFVFRFDRSASVSGFLAINPNGNLDPVSSDLLDIFSNGSVAVLDIPCGTGGGLLGFLAMLTELRSKNVLKSAPLELAVFGGDYSDEAQVIYKKVFECNKNWLEQHGIYVSFETMTWDASQEPETANLFDKWDDAAKKIVCSDHVVLVTNFSGAGATNFKKFENSFRHIASRLFNRQGAFIWVEPGLANKSKNFFDQLGKFFTRTLPSFFSRSADMVDEFTVNHPVANRTYTARISVMRHQSEDSAR